MATKDILMDEAKDVRAVFIPKQVMLTTSVEGGGTITPES